MKEPRQEFSSNLELSKVERSKRVVPHEHRALASCTPLEVNVGRIDFNRVALFVHIASAGGVTAAATHLKLPKSSVSRSLSQLEAELGVELVVRTSRQFRLTDAGRSFFRAASKGIATVDGAREELRRENETPQGVVRIAAPPNIATAMLPPMIKSFVQRYPQVQVDLNVTGEQLHPIRDGFDLVFSTGKLVDSAIKVRLLATMESGIFATASYLREHGTPRRPSDLAKHACILRSAAGKKDRWRLSGPNGTVVVAVDGHIRVNDLVGAMALCAADGGLALLPLKLHVSERRFQGFERVLPDFAVRGEAVHMLYPAQRHAPLHVTMLRDTIVEATRHGCTNAEQTAVPTDG